MYIRDDGQVRFTFAQPKQILDIYLLLCLGHGSPDEKLCTVFDQETANGLQMEKYSTLLKGALNSIVQTFKRRTGALLQSGRGGVIVAQTQQASPDAEFELITWLVMKSV